MWRVSTKKSFEAADEVRTHDKARLEVVSLGTMKAGRMELQPGWGWSGSIKPIVGTDNCGMEGPCVPSDWILR